MTSTALILEGGALRGQYTAGVLDTFMAHQQLFDLVVGVSAGALCGTNYVSQQPGRTNRINVTYRHDKNYISVRRALHRQDIINLDYLFAPHGAEWEEFDEATYEASPMRFVIAATSLPLGRAIYFTAPKGAELVGALKASSAMPFISAPAQTTHGLCLDGGIVDSIPFHYALGAGVDRIVVIRTRERAYRKRPTSSVLARAYARAFEAYPDFVQAAIARPTMYNQQASELEALEKAGRIFVIAPQNPVNVSRLESDTNKLRALYETGRAEAEAVLPALQDYLA
ncbi:patatin-like phospholipase family protein [Lacticaseibacillus daqingensis]|uniref:patatin-like phospholipase family protein n=1 Tax=Lacticaseibacillus daqingensis TaxID=2486014 RepID=UPI000F789D79|nr:patatin family protein [Lacticaseibacillus daqingensis]